MNHVKQFLNTFIRFVFHLFKPTNVIIFLLGIFLIFLGVVFWRVVENIGILTTPSLIQLFPIGTPLPEPDRTAEQAVESVNLMLGFIQAGSIVIGALAVGAVSAGFVNTRRLEQQLEEVRNLRGEVAKELQEVKIKSEKLNNFEELYTDIETTQSEVQKKLNGYEKRLGVFNRSLSQVALAQRQIEMNNHSEALETLRNTQELTPDNAFICYFLGDTLARQGKMDEGINYLSKARELSKDFFDADVSYAYARRIQGDRVEDDITRRTLYAEAERIFLEVAAKRPLLQDISGESAFGALAGLYYRREDFPQAIHWYENAVNATPQNTYPLINLALLNFRLGKDDKAAKYFADVRRLSDDRVVLNPYGYWIRFDNITARIGQQLQEFNEEIYPLDGKARQDIEDVVDLVHSTARSQESIGKFIDGIKRFLQRAKHADDLTAEQKHYIQSILNMVRAEMSSEKYTWEHILDH